MPLFLVVKIVDVLEQPLDKVSVQADIAGIKTVLSATGDFGVQETLLPGGTTKVSVKISLKGFFDVNQDFLINDTGKFPTINISGGQAINLRTLSIVTRGSDFNAEVGVVLGKLRDAADKVIISKVGPRLSGFQSANTNSFSTPMLNPGGTGKAIVNHTTAPFTPPGEMFFVERVGIPGLVAIHHPGFPNPTNPQEEAVPLPYHLFFHPFIPWTDKYPFGFNYLDLVGRYVVEGKPDNKGMAYQNTVGGAKAIFVFPVGKEGAQMGDLNTETSVLRLFQEINFWVQRQLAVPFPRQPVGPIALSCFSAGVRFLSSVLQGPKHPDFHDRLLRHIFILDGVFAGTNGAAETSRFCKAMLAWHRAGQNKRTMRVYTQSGVWFQELVGRLPGEVITPGVKGSREAESPSGTLLLNPSSFWQLLDKQMDYFDVHQLIPSNFMEHAMTNSDFT